MEERIYIDPISGCVVKFLSDADQKYIDDLSMFGEWYVVKAMLLNWGYYAFELCDN